MANILIVDDDLDVADALGDVLLSRGHTVNAARNGEEALRSLRTPPLPDVVILDVEMPILDGPGVAHRMLLHDAGQEKIPIVLVSGHPELPQIAAQMGTPYFLSKPCGVEKILGVLNRAIAERVAPTHA